MHNTRLFGRSDSNLSTRPSFRVRKVRRRWTDKKAGAFAVIDLALETGGKRLGDGLHDGDHVSSSQVRIVLGVAANDGNLVGASMDG